MALLFLARQTAVLPAQTGDGTIEKVSYNTLDYNVNSCFTLNQFVAPISGDYFFVSTISLNGITTTNKLLVWQLQDSSLSTIATLQYLNPSDISVSGALTLSAAATFQNISLRKGDIVFQTIAVYDETSKNVSIVGSPTLNQVFWAGFQSDN